MYKLKKKKLSTKFLVSYIEQKYIERNNKREIKLKMIKKDKMFFKKKYLLLKKM